MLSMGSDQDEAADWLSTRVQTMVSLMIIPSPFLVISDHGQLAI